MTDPAVGVAISVKPIAGGSVIRVSAGQRTASDFRGANKSQLSIRAVRWVVRATSGDGFVDGAKARLDETRIRRRMYRREDPEEIEVQESLSAPLRVCEKLTALLKPIEVTVATWNGAGAPRASVTAPRTAETDDCHSRPLPRLRSCVAEASRRVMKPARRAVRVAAELPIDSAASTGR
jgi:hypothetical protein